MTNPEPADPPIYTAVKKLLDLTEEEPPKRAARTPRKVKQTRRR